MRYISCFRRKTNPCRCQVVAAVARLSFWFGGRFFIKRDLLAYCSGSFVLVDFCRWDIGGVIVASGWIFISRPKWNEVLSQGGLHAKLVTLCFELQNFTYFNHATSGAHLGRRPTRTSLLWGCRSFPNWGWSALTSRSKTSSGARRIQSHPKYER